MQQFQKPYVSLRQKAVSLLRWSSLVTVLTASIAMTMVFFASDGTKSWPVGWQLAGVAGFLIVMACVCVTGVCAVSSLIRESIIHWLRQWLAAEDNRLNIR